MSLPTPAEARSRILQALTPLGAEDVPLGAADGRVLAEPVTAIRDQPPYDASAMDGWAVRTVDAVSGTALSIVGESAAGHDAGAHVGPGEAVRIFTGAALPPGADRVVIQEQARRTGMTVVLDDLADAPAYVRPRGGDFRAQDGLLEAGLRLNPWRIALAASAGRATVRCTSRPRVGLLSTGDELVAPGEAAGDRHIYDACTPALAAFIARCGGLPVALPRARDTDAAILEAVASQPFDLLVTIGGASVGDHDRVKPALKSAGAQLVVEGIAVRPGKPTWFGHLGDGRPVLGLPGNPASALVCAELFLAPVLAGLQGIAWAEPLEAAILDTDLPANGPREHYMRALVSEGRVRVLNDQDSSLVTVMAAANALVRRLPHAPPLAAGAKVHVTRPIWAT